MINNNNNEMLINITLEFSLFRQLHKFVNNIHPFTHEKLLKVIKNKEVYI